MTLFMRSQIGCLVGGVAQYPRCGIRWNPLNVKCHPDFEIGQTAGISSGEFGLANMILAAVSVGTVRDSCYRTT